MSDSPSSSSSSSSGEEDFAETKKKNSKTVSKVIASDSSSSSDDDDGEWNAKPKSKSKVKRKKSVKKQTKPKKKMKTASSDDSDKNVDPNDDFRKNSSEEKEEGEVDFSEDENEEFNDGFDENLMGDEEDQRKLALMTEKEREQELFNRSEKREVLRTRFEIERKLRLAKKQEMKKKVSEKQSDKNHDISFTESASRSIERRRNMEDKRKVKDAMKGLKAEREKKKMKQKLKATDVYSDSSDSDNSNSEVCVTKKSAKKSSTSEDFSSDSSLSYDSDVEIKKSDRKRDNDWDHERSDRMDAEQEHFDFTIEHLNSIRLSRFKMEKWCHAPFFKDTLTNAFVRIGVGSSSLSQYIVGQIVDVIETPKIYILGKTKTNKGIKLKHAGNPEKVFRLEYVSNSEFTPNEYEQWHSKMIADKCEFPTKDLVERKKADIQKAIDYNYSEEDIQMIVAEKGRFQNKPINFAMKKTQLMIGKEYAELNGDHERAMEIAKEIDKLEEESKKIEKVRTQNIASISFINERNRMRNIKEAERAIAEAAKEAQNQKDDPFTRRKCAPQMIHAFNKNKQQQQLNDNQQQQTPESSNQNMNKNNVDSKENVLSDSNASKNSQANQNNKSSNSNKQSETTEDANDMFSVHNFDIKIDFESLDFGLNNANSSSISGQNSFSNNILFSNSKPNGFANPRANPMSNSSTNRRLLNLDEYKKKKGLI